MIHSHRCNPEYRGRLPGNSNNRQTGLSQIRGGGTYIFEQKGCVDHESESLSGQQLTNSCS